VKYKNWQIIMHINIWYIIYKYNILSKAFVYNAIRSAVVFQIDRARYTHIHALCYYYYYIGSGSWWSNGIVLPLFIVYIQIWFILYICMYVSRLPFTHYSTENRFLWVLCLHCCATAWIYTCIIYIIFYILDILFWL